MDPTFITKAVQDYANGLSVGDVDNIVSLFAENAVVEDPKGSAPHQGIVEIKQFYRDASLGVGRIVLEGNVRTCQHYGAVALLCYPKGAEESMVVESLDIFEFNEAGKITKMTAFWSEATIRSL